MQTVARSVQFFRLILVAAWLANVAIIVALQQDSRIVFPSGYDHGLLLITRMVLDGRREHASLTLRLIVHLSSNAFRCIQTNLRRASYHPEYLYSLLLSLWNIAGVATLVDHRHSYRRSHICCLDLEGRWNWQMNQTRSSGDKTLCIAHLQTQSLRTDQKDEKDCHCCAAFSGIFSGNGECRLQQMRMSCSSSTKFSIFRELGAPRTEKMPQIGKDCLSFNLDLFANYLANKDIGLISFICRRPEL